MESIKSRGKTIGILTGGGDVPGLNPAIRAVTLRAIKEGYKVIGIKNGWKGVISIDPSLSIEDQEYCMKLDESVVNRIGRTGGTFLHSSRTKADKVPLNMIPDHLKDKYKEVELFKIIDEFVSIMSYYNENVYYHEKDISDYLMTEKINSTCEDVSTLATLRKIKIKRDEKKMKKHNIIDDGLPF